MLELMPNIEWHKGCAVNWIQDHVVKQYGDAWSLYIGDDLTDEDGFRAVRGDGLLSRVAARRRRGLCSGWPSRGRVVVAGGHPQLRADG